MTKKIKLPSGATVTLKDPKTFKVKDREKVMLVADEAGSGDLAKALALSKGLLAIMIEEWSFDLMPPSIKLESLGELDMADYDFLLEQTKDAQKNLFPNLAETKETEADPKAPTENSKG